VAASQISRSISSSEKNHGLRFEGILKIQFARKSTSKGQKPANSITSAHPISQPAQGIQNSSRTTIDPTSGALEMSVDLRLEFRKTPSREVRRIKTRLYLRLPCLQLAQLFLIVTGALARILSKLVCQLR
jgi:hypothetical protein